jgi:hypothetical protein
MPILAPKVLGIGGNGQHGVRGGLEQEVIDHRLVLVGDGSDLGGQRENDVKIGDLQQLGLALRHPRERLAALALGTVAVATTAVRDHRVAALGVLATRHIAAERRRAAGLDRAHQLQLCVANVPAVGLKPSGAEVAEDPATSRAGRCMSAPSYFRASLWGRIGVNRSSGLLTLRIILVATVT